jgi:DNA-binding MarR family transcriptional regulator
MIVERADDGAPDRADRADRSPDRAERSPDRAERATGDPELTVALERLQRLMASRSVFARQAEAAAVALPQQAVQVLRALAGEPPRAVAEVARAARMDVGAVSRQLRVLEDAGLASRRPSPTNGTVVLTEATPAGHDLARRFKSVGDQHLRDVLDAWSARDREQLGRLLLRFVDDLQRTPYRAEEHRPARSA